MALAKAAVVVGVSHMPGLGFAISKRFAQGGLKVGIIGRSKERLDAVKSEIEATVPGSEVACAVADASDAAAVTGRMFGCLNTEQLHTLFIG